MSSGYGKAYLTVRMQRAGTYGIRHCQAHLSYFFLLDKLIYSYDSGNILTFFTYRLLALSVFTSVCVCVQYLSQTSHTYNVFLSDYKYQVALEEIGLASLPYPLFFDLLLSILCISPDQELYETCIFKIHSPT